MGQGNSSHSSYYAHPPLSRALRSDEQPSGTAPPRLSFSEDSDGVASGATHYIPSSIPAMADSASLQIRENFEALQKQLNDRDFLSLTLTYNDFLSYITKLNEICRFYPDEDNCCLVFAVKKGTDSTFLWKATVRVTCLKYHAMTAVHLSDYHRLLSFRQFIQMFRRISYECSGGIFGEAALSASSSGSSHAAPTTAASSVLREMQRSSADGSGSKDAEMEECIICLERQPDLILPCAHAYCTPCIVQWWEYEMDSDHLQLDCRPNALTRQFAEKKCPVCREIVKNEEDSWVISETPDDLEVANAITEAFVGITGSRKVRNHSPYSNS